mgnify:CR=1 FL=1
MPQKAVVATFISPEYLIERTHYDVIAGRQVSDGANVDSSWVVGKRAWFNDPIGGLICLPHCSAVFKLLFLRHEAAIVRDGEALERKVVFVADTCRNDKISQPTLFPSECVSVQAG